MTAVDEAIRASPVLHRLLEDPGGPVVDVGDRRRPTRRGGGRSAWHVVVTGDVYTPGVVGRFLEAVRTRRSPVADTVPDALARLAATVDATVAGDGLLGRDGSLLVPVRHAAGRALLRVAVGDAAVALDVAADAHDRFGMVRTVPRGLARARVDDVTVTVEERLAGRRPGRLTDRLLGDVADTLAQVSSLARASSPGGTVAEAIHDRADHIDRRCPSDADRTTVQTLAAWAAARLGDRPSGFEHGDLWHRNLLTDRGRLTGVVDWDSWTAGGVGGVDLVALVATWEQHRDGASIGAAVANRVWQRWTDRLARLGIDRADVDALGIAWWLDVLAGTLRRVPARRTDTDWFAATIGSAALATQWAADTGGSA